MAQKLDYLAETLDLLVEKFNVLEEMVPTKLEHLRTSVNLICEKLHIEDRAVTPGIQQDVAERPKKKSRYALPLSRLHQVCDSS
eukprot:ANDGO_05619.mRNA.1 hypothetical protein